MSFFNQVNNVLIYWYIVFT